MIRSNHKEGNNKVIVELEFIVVFLLQGILGLFPLGVGVGMLFIKANQVVEPHLQTCMK
jgi:hypothetical protein